MAKLLYVVHRYAPYPGGSEYNVQRYAEASLKLGHEVTVLAGSHLGNFNGIRVTSDTNVMHEYFDLCIVHGWTGGMQNFVIQNSMILKCPLFYMIIKPDSREELKLALRHADYIGCATTQDIAFATDAGHLNKIIHIDYPIEYKHILKTSDEIREEFEITRPRLFISVGGFAPHKGMTELVNAFEELNDPNTELCLIGYDLNHPPPDVSNCKSRIVVYHLENQSNVYELMSAADLLIWNSYSGTEGYGLVLLEAMLYGCEWIARNDAAGLDLASKGFGISYNTKDQLIELMRNYAIKTSKEPSTVNSNKMFVIKHHDPLIVTANMLEKLNISTEFQKLFIDTMQNCEL